MTAPQELACAFAEFAAGVKSDWAECKKEIKTALQEYADELKDGGKTSAPDAAAATGEKEYTPAATPRELASKIGRLQFEALEFSFHIMQKQTKAQLDSIQTNSAPLHQCGMTDDPDFFWESLAEKTFTPFCRRHTLSRYNDLKRECRQFLARLNQSAEMQQARELLGSSAATLTFNFSAALPDSDVALDNEDWEDNMFNAFEHFSNFSDEVINQLARIENELEKLDPTSTDYTAWALAHA